MPSELPPDAAGADSHAGAPTKPRPAASMILLGRGKRHDDRGLQVLMVRRSTEASFMPGVWVFPGGGVEADEATDGVGGGEADEAERAHRACAVRELHEEAGIDLGPEPELVAWSRWITPEPVPVRFDTRFYLALAPAHCAPEPDAAEVSDAAWFDPGGALKRGEQGEIDLVFPTIKHLESLLPFGTADEALAAGRERVVEPILPRVVGTRETHRILLPGDPGY
jgi:8-oxo-dGTP pyrophosphatase MutT (NUDIX family)